jgi:Uma2 family endonuclease
MSTATSAPPRFTTVADLLHRLGDVPPERVRMWPLPGTATEDDVLSIRAREGVLCELVEDTLVEKPMGLPESVLAAVLIQHLMNFLDQNDLGFIAGESGTIRLSGGPIRMPDVAFYSWERMPNRQRPTGQVPRIAPDLAVEVLSPSNTRREMERKRREYFASGTRLVWEVDPVARAVDVYTSPDAPTARLTEADTLTAGDVLPGFSLSIRRWFERANRGG